jgi:starch phosphorylase
MDPSGSKLLDMPERIADLGELAYNFWWSWHPAARMLFKLLNRPEWKLSTHNPVKMLGNLDKATLEGAVSDPTFLDQYDRVMAHFRADLEQKSEWFTEQFPLFTDRPIILFSPEYGLHHSLPFYAGGLGFLAGDLIKECSDLGIPVTGVGFMYPEGYLKQRITPDGWQTDQDEPLERENAPIARVLDDHGNRLLVKVPMIAPPIFVEVWRVQIGKVRLFLIDTDIDANDPWNRGISSHLYIGSPEQRLRQEIVLGIGGTEVLKTLGITCSILHLNEGHTAFAILERIRERVESGMSFQDAFEQVRATTVFTTHTPVPAGHEVFPFSLMEKYFNAYWPSLGLDREAFLQLGVDPQNPSAGFNMTAFALKASGYHNGVSERHGTVARRMWHPLWPDLPEDKVPIDHITNGIHLPTWIEPKMELLFDKYLGATWLAEHDTAAIWQRIDDIPDEELWSTHYWLKTKLILKIMERARQRWTEETPDPRVILAFGVLLDPNVLTLGFARRFATYKRATLILRDRERLKRLVNDRWRPVQIIFAGKAHPADDQGKQLIQQVFSAAKDPSFGGRIAFVEDYDEQFAQYLVHGVDVWLNNPLPPNEACGTSGMKAALNGVPNLSISDGWWLEGFNGRNGWAFGDAGTGQRDVNDATALYQILEEEVIPLFYKVDDDGVPHRWVQLMKESIKSTAPIFNTRRMMKEYTLKFYQHALQTACSSR